MGNATKIAHQAYYNYAVLNESETRAYIHAHDKDYNPPKNVRQSAYRMLHSKTAVKEIARLLKQKKETLDINRERQSEKYEELRLLAIEKNQLSVAEGCLDKQSKLYGLSIDVVASGDEEKKEVAEEIKQRAGKVADAILDNAVSTPEQTYRFEQEDKNEHN